VNQDSTVPIALPFTEHLDAIPPPTKTKCAVKGCPSFVPIVLIKTCSQESCDKFVHPVCYELEERKNSCSKTATTVVLAEHFRRMSDALGSSVKAAYNCEDFVRFLDKKERKELKRYKKEMATENDSSSSESD
jgi:hypothetical protein